MEKVCERVRSESKFNVEIWIIKFNSIAIHYPIVVIFFFSTDLGKLYAKVKNK